MEQTAKTGLSTLRPELSHAYSRRQFLGMAHNVGNETSLRDLEGSLILMAAAIEVDPVREDGAAFASNSSPLATSHTYSAGTFQEMIARPERPRDASGQQRARRHGIPGI